MKLHDITDALTDGDTSTMRRGFCALVDQHDTVEASSPGMLVVALNRLCVSLKNDQAELPAAICAALGLPCGSTYAQGSAAAKRDATRLARLLMATG